MNRNRVNKKRMGRARVLSRAAAGMLAAALCFQPMTGGRFFSYIVILECGTGRRFGQLQFGKYRQLWRFDFCF